MTLDERLAKLFASDPEVMQDPYALVCELRETAPVHRLGKYVLVSSYSDARTVLFDATRFGNKTMEAGTARYDEARAPLSPPQAAKFDELMELEQGLAGMSDGAEHDQRRRATSHLFTPARIKALEALTQSYADELLDGIADCGVVDLVPITANLPGWIVAELLGLPRADSALLVDWGDAIMVNFHGSSALDPAHEALQQVHAYVADAVGALRSGERKSELFGAILAAADSGQRQLGSMFVEMQIGGYETTRGLLGGGVLELMRNRDQWERLVAEPDLAGNATEELLRMVSPALWTARVAIAETEVGGIRIRPEDTILVVLGAANRDPAMFERPDELDITRGNARKHVAFGVGVHVCLGQALARLEGAIFFRTLATRFPELRLVSDEIHRTGNANNPKLETLRVDPGRAVSMSV